MKNRLLFLLGALALTAGPSHGNLVANGNFEEAPVDALEYPFSQTPSWFNWVRDPKAQNAIARKSGLARDGSSFSAVVNSAVERTVSFSQNTGHKIGEGEVYRVAFDWRDGQDWQPLDTLRVVIFATTDNKLGGPVAWESAVDFQKDANSSWTSETHAFPAAPPDVTGLNLFLNFYGMPPSADTNPERVSFARVDDIVLTVEP